MALFSRKKSRTQGASDPAKLLIAEHQKVERLFAELDAAGGAVERQGLIAQIDAELSAHTAKEEAFLYPWVVRHVPRGGSMIDHANHEHGLAKQALGDLVSMDPGDEGLLDVAHHLQGLVEAHVKEEEKALFPAIAKAGSGEELASLRADLEAAKFTVVERALPTDPTATRPTARRKAAAKKVAARKAPAAKNAPAAKRAAAKKVAAKKVAAKKAPAKKAPAKKVAAKKAAARRR